MKYRVFNLLIIFTCIICGITLVIIKSLLWTDNNIQSVTKASYSSQETEKALDKSSDLLYLDTDNINILIQAYVKEFKTDGKLQIGVPHIDVKESKLFCYAPVRYGSLQLLASCVGTLKLQNDNFVFEPQSFKIGKVSLPKKLIMKNLKSYSKGNINIDDTYINVKKAILPISVSGLVVDGNTIAVKLNKADTSSPLENSIKIPNSQNSAASEKNDDKKSNSKSSSPIEKSIQNSTPKAPEIQEKQQANLQSELLLKTSNQLRAVYTAVKTSDEKKLILLIQNTVTKLIENSSINISETTTEVIKQYSKLTETERTDLKNSLLSHMEYSTLVELKSKFGL